MQEYDPEYYAEESEDDPSGDAGQYMPNYPPTAMSYGGGQKMMAATQGKPGGAPGFGGAMASASGVPFYGQQNKMNPVGAMGGYGAGAGGIGAFGQVASAGAGGGFTYGMASKGGNIFGAPAGAGPSQSTNMFQTGATQFGGAQAQNPGLFQFGSVSQFGGLGGAGSLFGGTAGAGNDDPYANIALDLTKVKKSEPPPKLYEHKTEEEKKGKTSVTSSGATKSNLKKDAEDKTKPSGTTTTTAAAAGKESYSQINDDGGKKKGVTFGKSTTYEVAAGDADDSGEYHTKDVHEGGKGSPRPSGGDKKVIGEKDLSDGRTEKEKILEMLEKQQKEQIDEIREMNQWKSKVDEKKASAAYDESVGESSTSNQPIAVTKKSTDQSSGSYESDDFEDVSASGSGSKSKLNYWPGKSPQSAPQKAASSNNEYDPNAMEEYMKKQQQSRQNNNSQPQKKPIDQKDQSESSDKYDEDFESVSRSQTGLALNVLPGGTAARGKPQPFEYKPAEDFKSPIQKYLKKENVGVQTEEGKYSFMTPTDIEPSSYKEWTLTQNLKDAESLIQDLKSNQGDLKQRVFDGETSYKKKDVEFQTVRRDSLNAQETAKRLQEQLKDAVHKINLYKIETEELIKQIDLADAKTREKEDDLKLCQVEYERKLKLQEERILFRQSKQEERETYEVKRLHMIEKEELQQKVQQQQEEIDYFIQKVAKIEAENKSLRLDKDQNKKIKELEEQIDVLKSQVQTTKFSFQKSDAPLAKGVQKELSKDEQMKLQREVQQLELMLKGYQEESEKSLIKQKGQEKEIKLVSEKLLNEQKRVKELQQKALLDRDRVFVEETNAELDIDTVNTMGLSNAISQQSLKDMHVQIQKLQNDKLYVERDLSIKEGQLKSQINKIREEKVAIEKQLYDTEFLLGDRDSDIQKMKDEFISQKQSLSEKIKELEDKVSFFRQNQKLLSEDENQKQGVTQELLSLREKCRKLEEESKRVRDLEKKCKLLEETIKARNPNSIPMMLQQVKDSSASDKSEVNDLKSKIKQLEFELDEKDKDYDKKLRTLRQESERIKDGYEGKKGLNQEAKKVAELEKEIETTKAYYNKRIREIEEKGRFKAPEKEKKLGASKPPTTVKPEPVVDTKQLDETIEKLTKERNLLAQKVVNLETQNNKRRQSFQGSLPDDSKQQYPTNAIFYIVNMIKQNPKDREASLHLIEAALICVEQLSQKDSDSNKKLSQLLLSLTQELNVTSKCNDKVLGDILDFCRPAEQLPFLQVGVPDLKRQSSAAISKSEMPNRDLIQFYPSPTREDGNASNRSKPGKPPKSSSNAFSNDASPPRHVRDILKSIMDIDFERVTADRSLNPKKIPLNQVYQIIKEEASGAKVTLDEVKNLIKYVRDKSSSQQSVVTVGCGSEEVDINDLVNAVMDVSLDLTGAKDNGKQQLNETSGNRYSNEGPPLKKGGSEEYQAMQQYALNNADKADSLQRVVFTLQAEKRELTERIEKLEQAKLRMEKILKQNLNQKGGASTNPNSELLDEIQLLSKRIEFMEQQSDERSKSRYLDHNHCNRQIMSMQQELDNEKNEKVKLLQKKNSEVAYFKQELDVLLGEIQASAMRKKRLA